MSLSLRRFAEIVFGPIILKRKISANNLNSVLCASVKVGGLKYLLKPYSSLDPELVKIAEMIVKTDAIVWDVGANVGIFSVLSGLLSGPGGRVISFEADTDAIALLNRTVHLNGGELNMKVVPVAISSFNGFLEFAIAKRARASNSIQGYGHSQTGGTREIRIVPCFTLDNMLEFFPAPNVLKIDVEGAEIEVLKGALHLFEKVRPAIYCEVSENTIKNAIEMLIKYGYRVFDAALFGVSQNAACGPSTSNIVALIPNEGECPHVQ